MPELYLRLLNRILTPILLLLAFYLLFRGHNLPGGGFIAGLMAASAIQLQILSRGHRRVRRTFGPYLNNGIGLGLAVAICAGFAGLLEGTFFKGIWFNLDLPLMASIKLGTPVVFDLGVFLVVASFTTSYLLGLSRVSDTAAHRRDEAASRSGYSTAGPDQADRGVATGTRAES
ncbi:MAG: Na(+)/H(+) antiporter subunit B [Caldilineaceae bacterium SB0668_bin_21]|nr:Na(+)/H(+) antiporter subunit B [Caldilineaceae bacterium SB0668_bin_21]MYC23678.1 Na(+)/H(+) antiporter subunit B [Caldilineaceae bacterium SB0662_bin_25]